MLDRRLVNGLHCAVGERLRVEDLLPKVKGDAPDERAHRRDDDEREAQPTPGTTS